VANAFISPFNTQTMHIKSFYTQQHCYVSLKTLYPVGIRTRVFSYLNIIFTHHKQTVSQTAIVNSRLPVPAKVCHICSDQFFAKVCDSVKKQKQNMFWTLLQQCLTYLFFASMYKDGQTTGCLVVPRYTYISRLWQGIPNYNKSVHEPSVHTPLPGSQGKGTSLFGQRF
jgi:hypothetical protein